jgi:hypothetical protein
VIQRSDGSHFALESRQAIPVERELRREDLQRDVVDSAFGSRAR